MRWECHVAAVGGEGADVAVDLVDVLNALGAQGVGAHDGAAAARHGHAAADRASRGRRDAGPVARWPVRCTLWGAARAVTDRAMDSTPPFGPPDVMVADRGWA